MMKLWIYLGGGHRQNGLFFGVISNYSRVFSRGQGTEFEYFWGMLTFNYFLGYA